MTRNQTCKPFPKYWQLPSKGANKFMIVAWISSMGAILQQLGAWSRSKNLESSTLEAWGFQGPRRAYDPIGLGNLVKVFLKVQKRLVLVEAGYKNVDACRNLTMVSSKTCKPINWQLHHLLTWWQKLIICLTRSNWRWYIQHMVPHHSKQFHTHSIASLQYLARLFKNWLDSWDSRPI